MKKLITTLSAIIAILLIASPVMASAETIPVMALQLSDPVVYMNDEPIVDMTGLMLQLAGGATSDGALTQLFVDVFAGGENVNSAVLQLDENGVAGYLGGMTSAYGVSSEAMGEMPVEIFGMTNLNEFLTALEDWTLFEDFGALVTDFAENGITYGEPETIEVDLAAGKTSMTYVPMTADATELTYSFLDLLENDKIIGSMFSSAAELPDGASMSDMLREAGFNYTVTGGVATTDDGLSVMMDLNYVIEMSEETVQAEMNMLMDGSMGDTQYLTMTYTMSPEGADESVTMTMNGTVVGEDVTLEGSMTSDFQDASENIEANFSLTYASAAGAGAGTDKLDFSFEMPGEGSMTLSAYAVEATGETHLDFNVKDDYTDVSAYFTFTPAAAADESVLFSGTLELGMNDGTDTYSVTCPVSLISTTIETDDFYIAPENVIDFSTMTEEESQAAQTELSMVMIQMLTKIEMAVPGLEGLTSEMMGTAQQ